MTKGLQERKHNIVWDNGGKIGSKNKYFRGLWQPEESECMWTHSTDGTIFTDRFALFWLTKTSVNVKMSHHFLVLFYVYLSYGDLFTFIPTFRSHIIFWHISFLPKPLSIKTVLAMFAHENFLKLYVYTFFYVTKTLEASWLFIYVKSTSFYISPFNHNLPRWELYFYT